MKMHTSSDRSGFTLIELLVVIAIIGVLSTLAIIALGSARQKSRDTKRLADLRQIGTALELYYNDNGSYPTIITPGNSLTSGSNTYLAKIPQNPLPRVDGNCPDEDYQYSYITATNTYVVSSCLSAASGAFTTTPIGYHTGSGLLNCGGKLIDRDGNSYRTVQLGTQCWMADNLRTSTKPNGTALVNLADGSERDCVSGSSNVRGSEADCTAGRAIYTWAAAMNLASSYNTATAVSVITTPHQGICPTGWHIPTATEMGVLETYLTDVGGTCDTSRASGNYSCTNAATKLKSGGTSGFNGIYTGYRSSGTTFGHYNDQTFYWSSTESSATFSNGRALINGQTGVLLSSDAKTLASSVRCVKD